MSKILQIVGIVLMCQIFVECEKEYYSPDNTVNENLKNVEPVSYVTKFKTVSGTYILPYKGISGDEELVRKAKSAKSTGPVHTYVKTDKNANFKWGVRHFVGKKYTK